MNIYVDVFLRHDMYGKKKPMFIRWNDGRLFIIDKINKVSPAKSASGMPVTKYDIIICGKHTNLYEDKNLSKWFVIEKS